MKGKPVKEGMSLEEAQEYAKGLSGDESGTGSAPAEGRLGTEDATRGDPRCNSDWIVVDCFWCATGNCVNPRWHTAFCRKCRGPFTY